MATQTIDFLNKNVFRKYPIQQKATCVADSSMVFPNNFITGLSLTIPAVNLASDYQPYIACVSIKNNFVSIAIDFVAVGIGTFNLCIFQGIVNQDYQIINSTAGFIRLGKKVDVLSVNGSYIFSSGAIQTGLEVSTYIVVNTPEVTNFNYREQTLTGNVTFGSLNNVTVMESNNTITLATKSTAGLESLVDQNSQFGNCPTPNILKINGAVPYPVSVLEDSNNIYLFGVTPIVIDVDAGYSTLIPFTPTLDLETFCTLNTTNLAPLNPQYVVNNSSLGFVGLQEYYSRSQTPVINFMEVIQPEFITWSSSTFNLTLTSPTNTTYYFANPTGNSGVITKIYLLPVGGSVQSSVSVTGTYVAGLNGITATTNGLVVLATGNTSFSTTDNIALNITSTSATQLTAVLFYLPTA